MTMGVFAIFCLLSLVISASASANITSSTGEDGGRLCVGQNFVVVCSITGAVLSWDYEGAASFYSASSTSPRPLNQFQTDYISLCNGVLSSSATVTVSDSVANAVNGTVIFCDDTSSTDGPANFTINISIKESTDISNLNITLISRYEIKLEWEGAQCASYYMIKVNGVAVYNTSETSYIYEPDPNETVFNFTVCGVDHTGSVFTIISKLYNLSKPVCEACHILADNLTLYIVVESENAFRLPITQSYVTFNSVNYNRSETDRVVGFDVKPGQFYNYSVLIGNFVGSTVCGNDSVPVPIEPSPTTIIIKEPELPTVILVIMIILGVLLIIAGLVIVVLSIIILKKQSSQDKRVSTTNKRTKSPDEEKEIVTLSKM